MTWQQRFGDCKRRFEKQNDNTGNVAGAEEAIEEEEASVLHCSGMCDIHNHSCGCYFNCNKA